MRPVSEGPVSAHLTRSRPRQRRSLDRTPSGRSVLGTDGPNPVSSTGESCHLRFPGRATDQPGFHWTTSPFAVVRPLGSGVSLMMPRVPEAGSTINQPDPDSSDHCDRRLGILPWRDPSATSCRPRPTHCSVTVSVLKEGRHAGGTGARGRSRRRSLARGCKQRQGSPKADQSSGGSLSN
jgi:hypothetical protein